AERFFQARARPRTKSATRLSVMEEDIVSGPTRFLPHPYIPLTYVDSHRPLPRHQGRRRRVCPEGPHFRRSRAKSRATADGSLPNECKWEFLSETRIGKQEDGQGCVRYFYKTTAALTQTCPAPHDKPVGASSERITAQGPFCPDRGKVQPPNVETKALSSGT